MKAFFVILVISITVLSFSFSVRVNKAYNNFYSIKLQEFNQQQSDLESTIAKSGLSSEKDLLDIRRVIEKTRLKLKNIDFWLRYFEPNAYRKINGPLPVEWENEVFEKFEPPYRREGAGLTLAELSLDQKPLLKDSLLQLIIKSREAIKTFEADSITSQLNSYSHFFLANRLFILNLAAIYTTGFECPDTVSIIPELRSMLLGTKDIYNSYNLSFPETPLSREYLDVFDKTIAFADTQSAEFSSFNQFIFIRDFVNPLFALNQKLINAYNVISINYNDYTLNNTTMSIFDKSLYTSQSTKGIYSMVEDEKTLNQIRYIGKLLFYDPILSGNNMRSCASCHKPSQYFTDTTISTAMRFDRLQRLPRNTPTLINSVFNHLLMLDGKHISLQSQGRAVITSPTEMNSNEKELLKKVLSCKEYKDAFKSFLKLTPEEKDITLTHIVSAITYYDGSYSRYYAPFDDAMNNKTEVSDDVTKGFNLFMSRAKCATCHFVPNFNGVKPPFVGSEFEVLGTPEDTSFRVLSVDSGRWLVNKAPETLHAFRTGSIRNAKYTRPYMHNGVFKTLEEVIDFYDVGGGLGKKMIVDNQTLSGDSLKLSASDKKELLAFIYSLNENIIFEEPPTALPSSSDKALNSRKPGGEY
ncbi:MAG TPA: cytochrome c peroxidase [Puia sp.]|jgi:cytochrome c peroxidase|nr:cytochrome c peroxidase [Puia sp.]